MSSISIFEIFKIGVGPSSSHTLGPWNAALDFVDDIVDDFDRIQIQLFGSLSKTGKGHASDAALILGLSGYNYKTIEVDEIENIINEIRRNHSIVIKSKKVNFSYEEDLIFEPVTHSLHPNTLIISIFKDNIGLKSSVYASVGGGFIEKEGTTHKKLDTKDLPYPIDRGKDILKYSDDLECSISEVVIKNELSINTKVKVKAQIDELIDAMIESVYRGCNQEGILPGGLNVKRRAKSMHYQLTKKEDFSSKEEWIDNVRTCNKGFNEVNKWVSCFALAVNEENAAMSRVVTAPTNGAAGVIPAVMLYYYFFCDYKERNELRKFLLTAGEIGSLFKKGATISAAVGGCQAEIGVSSAMAAAGLTEVTGGSPRQVLMAAEIAMEHHLGLTCDPVGGLVQVPCIERNAMGAIKAITASNLALSSDPKSAKVDIDTIIKTMWNTAQEMNGKYKETSEGGLAFNLPVLYPEC
ncbi:MAG: L-serine ammonia-lyase [Saprospiraceae bacterium]